jgi:hypothetical protein
MVMQRESGFSLPAGVERPLVGSPPLVRRSGLKKVPSRESTRGPFESSLRPYLNEIGAVPLLSAEEEVWLAQRSFADILEDQEPSVLDDILSQQALREQVDGLLARLEPRKQLVIRTRFGLLDDRHAYSLSEASQKLKVTRERVRQIEAAALADLRWVVRAEGGDVYTEITVQQGPVLLVTLPEEKTLSALLPDSEELAFRVLP